MAKHTWLIIVKHQEEVNQPGKLHRLEHLSNESQLTKVNHKPWLLLSNFTQGKMFHSRNITLQKCDLSIYVDKLNIKSDLLSQHIILQLDVECAPVFGIHHQEAKVQCLL